MTNYIIKIELYKDDELQEDYTKEILNTDTLDERFDEVCNLIMTMTQSAYQKMRDLQIVEWVLDALGFDLS
jgi:hypothetical protein